MVKRKQTPQDQHPMEPQKETEHNSKQKQQNKPKQNFIYVRRLKYILNLNKFPRNSLHCNNGHCKADFIVLVTLFSF